MRVTHTERGFAIIHFKDLYGMGCSIQKSSLATEDAIWLGAGEDRMHISQGLAEELIPILTRFVATGEIDDSVAFPAPAGPSREEIERDRDEWRKMAMTTCRTLMLAVRAAGGEIRITDEHLEMARHYDVLQERTDPDMGGVVITIGRSRHSPADGEGWTDPLIWWTSQKDCEGVGETERAFWPEYLATEFAGRWGRAGRGRLWTSPYFAPVCCSTAFDDELGEWKRIEDECMGGIVIRREDLHHVKGLRGFVTDLQLWKVD